MPEFNVAITISSFIAGVLTFFAPCTLPLVPAFLGIISGAGDISDPDKLKAARGRIFKHASSANSFILGALFALGWSPCVGPLLGSILLLASTSGTVLQGTFLLIVFSIGLGIPFLLTALLIGKAFTAFGRWGNFISIINKIAGVLL